MLLFVLAIAGAAPPFDRCVVEGTLDPIAREALRETVRRSLTEPAAMLPELNRLALAHPACDAVWMARAGAQHAMGDDASAVVSLRRAAEVATGREATRALAVALHRQGEGGTVLVRAAAASVEDPLLQILAARERPLSERAGALRDALEHHPGDADLARELVLTLESSGRPQEAVATGRALLQRIDDAELQALVDRIEAPFVVADTRRPTHPAEMRTLQDGTTEITVYSSGGAKRRLIERLGALGYTAEREVKGGVRYRSATPARPYVDLFDDGRVEIQEAGKVAVERSMYPEGQNPIPFISRRKLQPDRERLMEAIWLEVTAWRQARELEAFQRHVTTELPAQLTRLWEEGVPLYGGPTLATQIERRDALVDHWATRACSGDGDVVRSAVEAFLRYEVQESAVPLTADQVRSIEARSICRGRRLVLE